MAGNSKRWQDIFPAFMPVALAILFFYPVILQGKTFYAFDILLQFSPWARPGVDFRADNTLISDPVNVFYPFYHYLESAIAEGVFPLWNTSNFCGVPYTPPSHPLVYAFYLLFPVTVAHDLLLWLHLLGTGLFMVLYLKEIGLHPCASLIGSAAWMFNGYVMVWFEFENVLMMAATLPLILFLMERWFRYGTKTLYGLLIIAIGLSISVHYAHLLIYQFLFLGVYGLYRILSPDRRGEPSGRPGRKMWKLAAAFMLGICLSANFSAIHLSLQEDAQRTYFSFQALFQLIGRLPASYLVTLLFPDFYGNPALSGSFVPGTQSYNNYNELCIYGGVPTVLLALTCAPYLRERFVGFFFLSALTSLTMAMGSILYYPLAAFVPGLNLSTPTRILYVFGFSFSVLAALGSHMLLTRFDARKWWAMALWVVVLAFAAGLASLVQTEEGLRWATGHVRGIPPKDLHRLMEPFFDVLSPMMLKPLILLALSVYLLSAFLFSGRRVFMGILTVLLLYDLMSFGWIYNTASPKSLEYPETKGIRFLRGDREPFRIVTYGNFLHNTLTPFRIQDAGGYSSFYPKRYGEFLHLSQHGGEPPPVGSRNRWIDFLSFGSPLLDLINVKYLVTPPGLSVPSDKAELVYDGEMKIFRNKAAFPRAFFVPRALVVGSEEEVLGNLARFGWEDFRRRVILESPPPPGFDAPEQEEDLMDSSVTITAYGPNRIDLEIRAPKKGFVVISDGYHPEWRARVDGVEVPILRANSIMRAVPVNPGEHRMTLVFRPRLLMAGLAITASGWVFLCVLLLFLLVRRLSASGSAWGPKVLGGRSRQEDTPIRPGEVFHPVDGAGGDAEQGKSTSDEGGPP